ncbi:MAG: 30S ribosomal protein S13, partial [Candidatus Coatesbacteria bacterium]
MARIAGVEIPDNKNVWVALTYIYGIGVTRSKNILNSIGVELNKKVKDLSDEEITKIRQYIDENYKVEGSLRAEVASSIKRLISI